MPNVLFALLRGMQFYLHSLKKASDAVCFIKKCSTAGYSTDMWALGVITYVL